MSKNLKLIFSSICMAFCLVISVFTERFEWFVRLICPMHIPIFVCGLACGWLHGAAIGFLSPLFCFFIHGLPPVFPNGISMSFELATYGFLCGKLKEIFKKDSFIYLILIISMIFGRLVWCIVMAAALIFSGVKKVGICELFVYVVTVSFFGIIFQLMLVPAAMFGLKKIKKRYI
ncbi:MAG: ECF transporter S component [Clostridiales bacterium]|nr:ECF transporter S component [Clostridiales bacterium]